MSRSEERDTLYVSESRIVAATIFSEAAHVTRRVELPLQRGLRRVALDGLPPGLDPSALRVSTSRGLVRALESDLIERALDGTSDTVALRASVDAVQSKLHRLAGELEALRAELGLLDRLAPQALELPGGPTTVAPLRPEVFLAGLDVVARRRAETSKLTRQLEAEVAATTKALFELEQRLSLVGQTSGAARKQATLVVTLDVPEDGPSVLDLTYEAAWATWRPYYHVRSSGKDNTVECVRFADLWQETGEDWVDAKLRLSTAEPEGGLVVPAVLPWTLGLAKSYEDKVGDLYRARRVAKPAPAGEQDKKRAAPAKGGRASELAMAAPSVAMPMPAAKSRGGLFGGLGGGGAAYPVQRADDTFAEDDEAAATGDLVMREEGGGSDELDAYAQQFEDEGIFANITSAGVMMMRDQAPSEAAPEAPGGYDGGMAPPAPPMPGPGSGGAGRRRGPAPDHPDAARLRASRLPRDASGGLDFELEVGARATCLSGKERQRLGFGSVVYPAKIEYLLRPAVKDHAFGRVTVVNSEPVPMLAGPAAIFVGDAFFGETAIATTPPGGKLILDLGAETAIKSARRTKTTVRTEGILTKEDIHVVEVTIEIESFLGRTAELEVQDQVPLSRDPKIKVRLVRTSPKDAVLDELTGILTFRVRVQSGVKTELSLVYEIEAPKDYQFRQVLGA